MSAVLIIGATGTVGRRLVRELTQRGVEVRAFVRDEARARPILGDRVTCAVGDLAEPSGVARAAEGCRQLFLLTRDGPRQVEQATAAAEAAVRAGVEHIVKLSSSSAGPDAAFAWARDHYAIEQNVEALGVGCSHLRAHYFMQNLFGAIRREGGSLVLELPMGNGRISAVDARDVAACAAALLAAGSPLGRPAVITGASAFTMKQAAAALSAAIGYSVVYRDMRPEEHLLRLGSQGVGREQRESIALMYRWGRQGLLERITGEVEAITGRPPRSLDQFAAEEAPEGLAGRTLPSG